MKPIQIVAMKAFLAVFIFTNSAHATISYTITDLGTLGGTTSLATDVNDSGQVVGYSDTLMGGQRAFLWQAGALTNLGTVGIGTTSRAYCINARGQVAGTVRLTNGVSHAFLFDFTNGMQDIGNLGGSACVPGAINDLGEVVGYASRADDSGVISFDYFGGIMTAIYNPLDPNDDFHTSCGAFGINSNGWIVGTIGNTNFSTYYPFLKISNSVTIFNSLGTGGGLNVGAINSRGAFVGSSNSHAFLVNSNGIHIINPPGANNSFAYDINDSGAVVGQFNLYVNGDYYPFLYSDGTFYELNTLVTNLSDAGFNTLSGVVAISNSGLIVGSGRKLNGQTHAFVLTPQVAQAPRPQVYVLASGGVGAATIRLTGDDSYRFAVDASMDLVAWLPISTNMVSGGFSDFTDFSAAGKSFRFYRGRWVP